MKLVTSAQMQQIERRAAEDEKFPATSRDLMLNAGQSVFEAILSQSRFDPNNDSELSEGIIVVLAGSGNNGGDALVTSALLRQEFLAAEIKIYFYRRPRPYDPDGFPDTLTYTDAEEQEGIELENEPAFESLEADLEEAVLVVDGLLGAGLKRPVTGALARIIDMVNEAHDERLYTPNSLTVIAVDVPSGVNGDTGEVEGVALHADLTVSLGYPKIGLFNYTAADYTGRVTLVDIGLPPALATAVELEVEQNKEPSLITSNWVRRHLPLRPLTGHKGTFGKLMILGGSANYLGAPYLSTGAGMRSGAGLVTLAAPQHLINIIASKLSENTFLVLPEVTTHDDASNAANLVLKQIIEGKYQAFLLGPGLGQDQFKLMLVQAILEWSKQPDIEFPYLVLDADGLNLLAQIPDWYKQLPPSHAILTPHPGELGTLLAQTIPQIEADRIKSAQNAAQLFNQIVILKGAYSVIAAPDGRVRVNPGSNPAMATAGSGDVLAGIIGGLLTQFAKNSQTNLFDIACLGVYLHSMAGELVRREVGDMGALAGDFLPAIPLAVVSIRNGDSLE